MQSRGFKMALVQMKMQREKAKNVLKAHKMISEAAEAGADVIVLPEAFTCNYSKFPILENAEPIDDYETNEEATAARMLSEAAKEHSVYIIGGSIAERRDDGKIYNSSPCFDKEGNLALKYTKCHLFDVEIPEKDIKIKESDFYEFGDNFGIFETEYCKFGIGICYDARFPDFSQVLCREMGAEFLVMPAVFTAPTGEMHWDILRKTRALDNQAFFAFCSAARPIEDPTLHQCYGHSSIVDPWGKVICDSGHEETIVYSDIDMTIVEECRSQIPCYSQRRHDLYKLDKVT
ncbi:unnamed protein product [Moneuplotes crassus]|uniref:CN hydrolase domain-containing protein n=1 Tax=Euplotes crassus TaxID=5936 RepID=A0AAD1XQT5_EUPCR|nr:unnamed protein product [Moneuplotes crassus]